MSEEDYRIAAESSEYYYFMYDIELRTGVHIFDSERVFGLPREVTDMPESAIAKGVCAPESLEDYKNMFSQISAGVKRGGACLRLRNIKTRKYSWYDCTFNTVNDDAGNPINAIIELKDITEHIETKIAYMKRRRQIESRKEDEISYYELNITEGVCEYMYGNAAKEASKGAFSLMMDDTVRYAANLFVGENDKAKTIEPILCENLRSMFERGITETSCEHQCFTRDHAVCGWTRVSISMVRNADTMDIKAYCLFEVGDDSRAAELKQIKEFEEARKKLETIKAELENSRIRVMVNQLQPHFLYNTLLSIRTITKSDPKYAYNLLYDFTMYLRGSMRAITNDEPITLEEELKSVKAYINIEKMRFGKSLIVKYDIDCIGFRILPLAIQSFVDNAVNHGIYPKGEAGGRVCIRSIETDEAYVVSVEDDGVGFDFDKTMANKQGGAIGMKNVIFRLQTVMNASVNVYSVIGRGTKVTVSIPKDWSTADENNFSGR